MVGSPLAAFTNSAERLIARKSYVDYCTILEVDKDGTDGVKCHSPDHPEYYNTVSLKIRSTKLVNNESQDPNAIQHVNALILQTFVGNCFGEPYIPRVGDLVAVLFMYNEKPLVLGPVATIQQPPVMRAPTSEDAKYDHVNKWCQWLRPEKDKNYDYFNHPQGKKPICFKRFHGPVTGSTGIGRDEMTVWDCQKGDADPTCAACSNIDSVPRSGEQWHKIYSTQTESEEAYNSRMELHARCGSYFRIESDNTNESGGSSSEYSENIGHIRLGNALTETDKRFHFNVQGNRYGNNGVGSFDLHTNHEEVQIASESTGVRFAGIRPEDSQVDWAYEFMNFPTTSFIRCYKDGVIEINSLDGDSSITVDGTSNKVTVDGTINVELKASSEVTCTTPLTHVTGDMQIDGTCTHGSCSCTGTFASLGGTSGGQTLCGGTGVDEELTLCGTSDVSKGCVNVDADLTCSGSLECTGGPIEISAPPVNEVNRYIHIGTYMRLMGAYYGANNYIGFNSCLSTSSSSTNKFTPVYNPGHGFIFRGSFQSTCALYGIDWAGSSAEKDITDFTRVIEFNTNGNVWIAGDCSAATFTDHTPAYEGNALTDLKYVTNDDQGKINHKTLPKFAQAIFKDPKTGQEIEGQEIEGRNIGNMVSILVKAIQELTEELDTVKLQLSKLESK